LIFFSWKTNEICKILPQIAGKHIDVYEAYYRGLDPKSTNVVGAMDAAKFLKKSGLSDVVLSRVSFSLLWAMSLLTALSFSLKNP
jgi:hypothetical protein